jgi:hypothetical protein
LNQALYSLLDCENAIMKPYLINLLNAIVLVTLGSWAYLTSDHPSVTALIPVFAGIVLIVITPGFKRGNRVLAHIAVVLTLLILIGLIKPLTGSIGRSDSLAIARVSVMIITSLTAMVIFVKSFIDARRNTRP